MTRNLPIPVEKLGGDLAKVVGEIDKYTHQDYPLSRKSQYGLASIVREYPDLNDENVIALLVDMLSYHGVTEVSDLRELISDFGVDDVHRALELLYELGQRGRGESTASGIPFDAVIETTCFLERIRQLDIPSENDSSLIQFIYQLGGLHSALETSDEVLYEAYLQILEA